MVEKQRLTYWLLLPILLAFALRLINLDGFGFWTDEGLTPLRSGYSLPELLSNRITIQEGVTTDTHPALYYLLIHFTQRLFGQTDFAYRYPSLLAGVLLIPLLYQMGRHLRSFRLGFIVALLAAINPLQIWYGNEARMYTLLVLLGATMSFILWQALTLSQKTMTASTQRRLWQYLGLYFVFAALTLYTHYTAVFLIAAQGVLWAWLLWRQGQQRLIMGAVVIGVFIAVPLVPYTVPRLFTGAEANYQFVPPHVMLQDTLFGFSLGVTIRFRLLTTQLLGYVALILALLGLFTTKTWLKRSFLLIYLLAVVVGLMLGSLLKPMYQGVRHIMIGSPALLLLLALGIDACLFYANQQGNRSRWWFFKPKAIPAWIGALALLAGPSIALNNLYNSPNYIKDDFRGMITYIDEHAGDNDLVVYNNAILLPIHDHYRQRADIDVTALPIYPWPADDTPYILAELATRYDRIWFVTDPPADKRDEDKMVQGWLDDNLPVVGRYLFPAKTTEVRTIVYRTSPLTVEAVPENGRFLNLTWSDTIPSLRGLHYDFAQPASLPALWLDLYWQGETAPAPTTYLRFTLHGPDDREWATHGQTFMPSSVYEKTAASWPKTALAHLSYTFPIPVGTPPGTYTLFLQPFTRFDGIPLGAPQALADVALAPSHDWPIIPDPPVTTFAAPLRFQNGLTLEGITIPDNEVRPGHNLPLTLYWQADEGFDPSGLRYQLDVVGPDGTLLRTQSDPPGARWLEGWPGESLLREQTGLYFRPETEPGRYRLWWRLRRGDTVIDGRPYWRPWSSEAVIFGEIEVKPWPIETDLPTNTTLVEADFGPHIDLHSYELTAVSPQNVQVTLYWQAQAVPEINYFSFIHLISRTDGEIKAQLDRVPVDGLRPTRGWRAGEVLADTYIISLPPDLPASEYDLNVGLYDLDSEQRLPITYQDEAQPNNQLTLTTLTLP